jgi:glutamate formiminotransferase/formiminotetrahydrofolate cyclodeaminase
VLEQAVEALKLAREVARSGNPASVSDAGVGGACGLAAAEGAALNVLINLPSLTDAKVSAEIVATQESAMDEARRLADDIRKIVDQVLSDSSN